MIEFVVKTDFGDGSSDTFEKRFQWSVLPRKEDWLYVCGVKGIDTFKVFEVTHNLKDPAGVPEVWIETSLGSSEAEKEMMAELIELGWTIAK